MDVVAAPRSAAPAAAGDKGDTVSAADLARLNFAHHRAFIVGIDAYAKVAPLQTAVSDAQHLAEQLATQHHFSVHPPLLDAGGAAIRELLRSTLPAQVGADDRVLFYFAGHGIAADGDDGPAGYLVPADAEPSRLDTLIPMAELQAALDALPCRHLLLILDCCFSGAFKWSSQQRAIGTLMPKRIYEERFNRFAADPARQIITSAAYDQKALDVLHGKATGDRGAVTDHAAGDGRLHSPFALALYDALAGEADAKGEREGDGVITATEMYCYIRDRIEPATLQEGERLRQTPSFFPLKGHDKGEFMFLHPRHRLNLPRMPLRSPYKGLASFEETDQHLFYGRERVIAALHAKAEDPACRLLVVVGASGTGKSSVIKAGLLPALRDAGLAILPVMRPGTHPTAELTRVLQGAPASGKAVLLIDQFEELITRCADPAERNAFDERLHQLLEDNGPVARLIITVRSDFEPQLNAGALKQAWIKGRCTVPPFSLDELREVIVMPTIQEVLIFDPPELVDQIIGEVVQSPGALPLLSYALNELYEAYVRSGRSDRALKQDDYDTLGGVMGALRTKADALYHQLDSDADRDTMRKIMLRMVSVEGELAGKRAAMADLAYAPADAPVVAKVIERLVDARLVVRGSDAIEPAHDALVRAWKTLRDWIHEAGKDRLILGGRLGMASRDFERTRNPEFLWHDNPNLAAVEKELQDPRRCWFNAQEIGFIRRSVRRKKTRAWTLRAITAGVVAALAGLAGWAWKEKELATGTLAQARGFTDKLMFDVVDKLRSIDGTRDVRVELVREVGALQGKLSGVGAKDDPSTVFWTALLEGDIERERGRRDAARAKYEQAAAIAQALAQDQNWQRNLSVAYGQLGELAVKAPAGERDFAAARDWYQKALAIDRGLAGLDGANSLVQRDLMISTLRLGHLEKDASQQERAGLLAARGLYEQVRAIAERLEKLAPDDAELQRVMAGNLLHLAQVAYALAENYQDEEAARARALFMQALDLAERRPEQVLQHTSLQYDLSTAYGVLAKLQVENGQLDAARSAARQSLAIARRHAAALPDDAEWQRSHLLAQATLGDIEWQAQNRPAARRAYGEALKIGQHQARAHPQDSAWQSELFSVLMQIGEIELAERRLAAARGAFVQALAKAGSEDERQRASEKIAALSGRPKR